MKSYYKIMPEYNSRERADFFIIRPVGSINTNTYMSLQKEIELILESGPETILFDMKQVNYINFSGLRVILKTIVKMSQLKGNVYITDLQPQVKEMFEIMIGALPHWLSRSRKQLENCLDENHLNHTGNSLWIKSDETEKVYCPSLSNKKRTDTVFVSESGPIDYTIYA
ncbi:MAG: STAS domain-containing protein [Desulfobacterales bacterium]